MRCFDIDEKLNDLRSLSWREKSSSSGTAGMFLKAKEQKNGKLYYYKLSNYDSYRGIFGHECVNEIIVCRLLNLLGIGHLQYKLIHAVINVDGKEYETRLCRSENFRKPGERKQALDVFYDLHKEEGESPLEMCERFGFGSYVRQMMLADFLCINRDRHGANIEVLISENSVRLAPLFDNGISFLAPLEGRPELYAGFNPMDDLNTNNYLGSRSLFRNLELLDPLPQVDRLQPAWKDELFSGLENVIEEPLKEKIWSIVSERWNYYEKICDKKQII